jgi:hypothetical protein
MRKSHHIFCFFVLVTSLSIPVAKAEFACSSEVLYKWTKNDIDSNAADGLGGSADSTLDSEVTPTALGATPSADPMGSVTPGQEAVAQTTPTTSISQASTKPLVAPGEATGSLSVKTVKFSIVERRGSDQPSAKSALLVEVQRQKLRAAERCKRAHESFGECVTTKLSIKSSTLNSLSFSARSQAEKALMDECKIQQGRCLAVEASQPNCREVIVPATPTPVVVEQKVEETPTAVPEPTKAESAPAKKQPAGKAAAKK